MPCPRPTAWKALDLADWEYRPVEVTGRFRNDLEAHVYTLLTEPRGPLSGPGYWVLTPLEVEGGAGTVIVNRGFVPLEPKDPATPMESQVDGPVNVRGLLRAPEDRNLFTPADEPQKRLFYARDPGPIGKALGIANGAAFTLDAAGERAGRAAARRRDAAVLPQPPSRIRPDLVSGSRPRSARFSWSSPRAGCAAVGAPLEPLSCLAPEAQLVCSYLGTNDVPVLCLHPGRRPGLGLCRCPARRPCSRRRPLRARNLAEPFRRGHRGLRRAFLCRCGRGGDLAVRRRCVLARRPARA